MDVDKYHILNTQKKYGPDECENLIKWNELK